MIEALAAYAGPALELSRWYDASVTAVFAAFTDPDLLRQWWGPRGFTMEALDFEPVEGNAYRIVLRAPDGSRYVHVGEFLQVVAPSRLSYSWRWVEGPLPRGDTLVELRFEAVANGTEVYLRHSGFHDASTCDAHVGGWSDSFDRYALWLAARGAR